MSTPVQIKLIHTLKGALCLDDATYRDILAGYGVASSKALSSLQAARLIHDLEAKAIAAGVWKGTPRPAPAPEAAQDRQPTIAKIGNLLAAAGRPWTYADAMARNMFKVHKLHWCQPEQLRKIVAALVIDQKRRARKEANHG